MTTALRLFAAIVPPEEVLGALAAELERIGASGSERRESVRWVPRSLWHLTLAFYGNDDLDARVAWLRERLVDRAAVRLNLEGAGVFPGVLWTGVHGDLDALTALAVATGEDQRERPYHAHITVARWKGARRPPTAREWAAALAGYRGPPWQAREVVLMSSELGRRGPRYTVRERFQLI